VDVKVTLQDRRDKPGQRYPFDALKSSPLFSSLSDDQSEITILDRQALEAMTISEK